MYTFILKAEYPILKRKEHLQMKESCSMKRRQVKNYSKELSYVAQ